MGVRKLKGYIHHNQDQQLQDFKLHHATAIIDGSELFYTLYFDHDNGRRGGEYSSFRRVINDFFDTLVNRCSIRCYVVFDRFKSENHIERYLNLRTKKLQYVTNIVNGQVVEEGVRAQPCLGKDVLKQTLSELSVPYIVVPGDGDAELAAIANRMDGYVLATDTDFCVFELTRGFIPLDYFHWREANDSCRCKIFHRRTLEERFRLPAGAIAFLEPLLSNQDDIQVDFTPFFRRISQGGRQASRYQQRAAAYQLPPNILGSLLTWLGNEYRNDDSTIRYIRQYVPNLPENEFRRCLETYRNPPDVTDFVDDLLNDGHSFGVLTQCFNILGETSAPADFLPILPDDQDRPSCNKIGSSIRHGIYQMGFMKGEAGGPADQYHIFVTDRKGREYKAEVVNVTVDRSALEALHVDIDENALNGRDDMNEITNLREKYILDILSRSEDHGYLEDFNNDFKLLAAVFKYWSSSTDDDERHVEEAIKALAFTLAVTHYGSELISDIADASDAVFDKQALHSSSQWLCCVKDANALNVVLGKPLMCIEMGRLFSGMLYQKVFSYFASGGDDDEDDDQPTRLFTNHAEARRLYERLLNLTAM